MSIIAVIGLFLLPDSYSQAPVPRAAPDAGAATPPEVWCIPAPTRTATTITCWASNGTTWTSQWARQGDRLTNGLRGATEFAPTVLSADLDNRLRVAYDFGAPLLLTCAVRPGAPADPAGRCAYFYDVRIGTRRFISCSIGARAEGGGALLSMIWCHLPNYRGHFLNFPVGNGAVPPITQFAYPSHEITSNPSSRRPNPIAEQLEQLHWGPPSRSSDGYREWFNIQDNAEPAAQVVLEVDYDPRTASLNAGFGCSLDCRSIVHIHPANHPRAGMGGFSNAAAR